MKKNFLITTGMIETWEFSENNFLLGKWCEFYEFNNFDKSKIEINYKDTSIFKNTYHWEDNEKKIEDHAYLKKKLEYLLEIISKKLSIVHDLDENKEYWRIVISTWLDQYVTLIFDRWETIRIFFEKNKINKFYSNFISLNDSYYISKNHYDFFRNTQKDEWNHLIFLRLFRFLNIQNLSLIEKKVSKNNLIKEKPSFEKRLTFDSSSHDLATKFIRTFDKMVSKFAFKFNEIIFDTFYFPKKEFLKICLRCKLIPSKYTNFFDFEVKENNLSKDNKRIKIKNLLFTIDTKDKFIQFLLSNIHKDMPMSYLENFDSIKQTILPYAKKRKIIFSMHSLFRNDNFKIYIAETKKVGSRYIYTIHGGGLTYELDPLFSFFEKVSDKIIRWDNSEKKENIFVNLSPTLPIIKLKNSKAGSNCTIIFCESSKYLARFIQGPGLDQTINLFNEIVRFVNKLDPEIKSKIKFRTKINFSYNSEKKFSEIFGEKHIDKISLKNPLKKTILNSRLIMSTYPDTAFSEAMYSNVPTILIIKKNYCLFSKTALHTFNDLKKNKIAFEDFDEARIHINKYWDNINLWWESADVQSSRKKYLRSFFNVKSNWYKEWSDYISYSQSS